MMKDTMLLAAQIVDMLIINNLVDEKRRVGAIAVTNFQLEHPHTDVIKKWREQGMQNEQEPMP